MDIKKIAVVGAGTMGGGIAQVAAECGHEVLLADITEEAARIAIGDIRTRLEAMVSKGRIGEDKKDEALRNMRAVPDLKSCREADLIIEAVAEREEVKEAVFNELDRICRKDVIFATNTSAISITRLAAAGGRPARFIGMHFMNPAHKMKLLEIVRGLETSDETVAVITNLAAVMGKTPVVVRDYPGFVASRLILHGINEAIQCLQEGVASRDGIDTIMRLGARYPMGPLELADFIGLDICLATLDLLHRELGEKYRPCMLLRKMVEGGRLGRKSGEGFYEYP